jgi:hypothetical protein
MLDAPAPPVNTNQPHASHRYCTIPFVNLKNTSSSFI